MFIIGIRDKVSACVQFVEFQNLFLINPKLKLHKNYADLFEIIYNNSNQKQNKFKYIESVLDTFRRNNSFFTDKQLKVVISANMSSGKSTLVNALVGRIVAKTSGEACTSEILHINNKPFEDDTIHLQENFIIDYTNYKNIVRLDKKDDYHYLSTYYRTTKDYTRNVCIIDTAGVNSAINRSHAKITKQFIKEDTYDLLIFVLNAEKLGTDDELKYLNFLAHEADKRKIIFVINKFDEFGKDDSIEESIDRVRQDMLEHGYEKPIICPISATFSLLINQKMHNEILSDDEAADFYILSRKFNKKSTIYLHTMILN